MHQTVTPRRQHRHDGLVAHGRAKQRALQGGIGLGDLRERAPERLGNHRDALLGAGDLLAIVLFVARQDVVADDGTIGERGQKVRQQLVGGNRRLQLQGALV